MDKTVIAEYRRLFSTLDIFWKILGYCPYRPHVKSRLGKYFNYCTFWNGCWVIFFFYMIMYEVDDLVVLAQMGFVVLGSFSVVTRTTNGICWNKEMVAVFKWFEENIENPRHPDYVEIMRKHFVKQNQYIKWLMRFNKILICVVSTVVVATPILAKAPSTPLQVNGKSILGHSLITDILIVVGSLFRTLFAFSAIVAYDTLFMVEVAIVCVRFRAVRELLTLINYEGARDREKDQRILRDIYFMHLELVE